MPADVIVGGQCDCSVVSGQCDCSVAAPPWFDGLFAGGQCDCSATGPHTLTVWLHLTDQCNLRCAYCYLPHKAAAMSPETGQAAIAASVRSAVLHGYERILFKYAGGEPLLHFPLLAELHRAARQIAGAQGLAVEGLVLSNGTLLNAHMVATMHALGLQLTLSLDGIDTAHNQQRPFTGGNPSFAAVAAAVELARSQRLTPGISMTVSGRNAADLPALVGWVLERDLPFAINFYRENDYSASQPDLRYAEQQMIQGMLAAYAVIEHNLPRRSLLASLVDGANLAVAHQHPCGVGHSYLVFDTQGRVVKCQMQLGQAADSPVLTTAWAADPLAAVRDDRQGLQNPPIADKADCQVCQWRAWCAGGCPLQAHRASGRYDAPSPNCHIYQTLYPEVLHLERLRVARYERSNA